MSAVMDVLSQLAKITPEPDLICTTEAGVEALARKANLVAPTEGSFLGSNRYAGMEVRAYPVGTVIWSERSGERHTIEQGSFLVGVTDDMRVEEPAADPISPPV